MKHQTFIVTVITDAPREAVKAEIQSHLDSVYQAIPAGVVPLDEVDPSHRGMPRCTTPHEFRQEWVCMECGTPFAEGDE
jgi:hypothetical protein